MKKIIIITLLLTLVLTGCSTKTEEKAIETYVPIEVTTPTVGDISKLTEFSGTIISENEVIVSSELMSVSTAKEILVLEGQYVKKDDILVVLTDETVDTQQKSAKAAYDLARSNYEIQKASYELSVESFKKTQELYNQNLVSQSEYDQAKLRASDSQYNLLKAQLEQAKINYDNAIKNSGKLTIVSPVDGIVSSVNMDKNNKVSTQNSITIVDTKNLFMEFSVPESKAFLIKEGMSIKGEIMSLEKEIDGTVESISFSKDGRTNMYKAKAKVTSTNLDLVKMGMKIEVIASETSSDVYLLPIDSVINSDGSSFVYVYENENIIKKDVELGKDNGEMVEIISGLEISDYVVIKGQSFLKEDSSVKVIRGL